MTNNQIIFGAIDNVVGGGTVKLDALAAANINWTREDICFDGTDGEDTWLVSTYWTDVQTGNVLSYDDLFISAAAFGIYVLPLLTGKWPVPSSATDYAAFVFEVVSRYGPNGTFWTAHREIIDYAPTYFEIWNEPYATWWETQPTASNYADLYIASVISGREADDTAKFLCAMCNDYSIDNGETWTNWVDDLYTAVPNLNDYFDACAIHPYSHYAPDLWEPYNWTNSSIIETIHEKIISHGGPEEMWITEVGWTTYLGEEGNTEAEQASYLNYLFDLCYTEWTYIKSMFIYALEDIANDDPYNKEDWFGIIRSDGSHKPAYGELVNIILQGETMTDIPDKYDVKINDKGYVFYDPADAGSVWTRSKAQFGYSSTFVDKQNTQSNYGDDMNDFFLSWSQKDWSKGEGQKYYRQDDEVKRSMYWKGSNIDISQEGEINLSPAGTSIESTTVKCSCRPGSDIGSALDTANYLYYYYVSTSTIGSVTTSYGHIFKMDGAGTKTELTNSKYSNALVTSITTDGINLYTAYPSGIGYLALTASNASDTTSFSSTGSSEITYHNNSLYGIYQDTLYIYSSSGVATAVGYWKNVGGSVYTTSDYSMLSFGGDLYILRSGSPFGTELWTYDGTGISKVNTFPSNFIGSKLINVEGIMFISGIFVIADSLDSSSYYKQAIMYFSNGTTGISWQSNEYLDPGTQPPAYNVLAKNISPTELGGKIYFIDKESESIKVYDLASGSIYTKFILDNVSGVKLYSAVNFMILSHPAPSGDWSPPAQTNYIINESGTLNTTGYIITSLFDLNSSLTKSFRGVKIEATIPTATGTSSSVDVYYQTDSLDGSWTLAQSSITSGTEINLTGVTGRSIAFKIVLNKGTTTEGPTLKRLWLRAAPELTQYRQCKYELDLSADPVILRDETPCPRSGQDMAEELVTAIESTTPISVEDVFGTYTAFLEPDKCSLNTVGRKDNGEGLYVAEISAREV